MEKLSHARSYRDLFAYQQARALAKDIFEISKRFPCEEIYSLTDQIRRSSRSIGAQIAEAWGVHSKLVDGRPFGFPLSTTSRRKRSYMSDHEAPLAHGNPKGLNPL